MKWIFLLCSKKLFLIYLLTFVVFFVEVLTYHFSTFWWKYVGCAESENCLKVLLVADPQLIGPQNENYFVTPFAVWDSDRYLSKTFSHAFKFTRPDLVIFLGDLFDEGSQSTNEEFSSYVVRLQRIFEKPWTSGVQRIYIPGDNDIGGESDDYVTKFKVDRFNKYFRQQSAISTKNFLTIHNINRLLPITVQRLENENHPIIGISHLPLITIPGDFVQQVLHQLEPHIFFTAHDHRAMIIQANYSSKFRDNDAPAVTRVSNNAIYTRQITSGQVHEFQVPTCSYRMGTSEIGYGFAVIEKTQVQYTVLWTPSRFPQLIIYVSIIFICFIWFFCVGFCSKRRLHLDSQTDGYKSVMKEYERV